MLFLPASDHSFVEYAVLRNLLHLSGTGEQKAQEHGTRASPQRLGQCHGLVDADHSRLGRSEYPACTEEVHRLSRLLRPGREQHGDLAHYGKDDIWPDRLLIRCAHGLFLHAIHQDSVIAHGGEAEAISVIHGCIFDIPHLGVLWSPGIHAIQGIKQIVHQPVSLSQRSLL